MASLDEIDLQKSREALARLRKWQRNGQHNDTSDRRYAINDTRGGKAVKVTLSDARGMIAVERASVVDAADSALALWGA